MTATQRQIVSMLVAWCPDCEVWLPEEEIGNGCLMDCKRKLLKRRRWVCQECLCSYRGKVDVDMHSCHECY